MSGKDAEWFTEMLIVDVFEELSERMQKDHVSYADLSRLTGTSRAHITQCFSGSRNATLNTAAKLAFALGYRFSVKMEKIV